MRYKQQEVRLEKLKEILEKKPRLEFGLCGSEWGTCTFCGTIESEWACRKPPALKECPLRIHCDLESN